MEIKVPVLKENFNRAKTEFIGLTLNLTKLEILIISSMIDLNISFLDKKNRDQLRSKVGKDKATFNNYIYQLTKKGVLYKENKRLNLKEDLKSVLYSNKLTITLDVT